jgi:hypothetical protein
MVFRDAPEVLGSEVVEMTDEVWTHFVTYEPFVPAPTTLWQFH